MDITDNATLLGGCRVYPFEATNPQERIEQLCCPRRGEGQDARNKITGGKSNQFIG
jgi:hypothetical protein